MPVLDRQAVARRRGARSARPRPAPNLPPSLQGLPPRSVPETAPTPLQKHYVLLSVPVLILGAIAITALEIGVPLGSPLIKLCVLIAAPLLVITTADAVVRIWRSAWAWMPVDRTKGLFRLAWVVVSVVGLAALIVASSRRCSRDGRRRLARRPARRAGRAARRVRARAGRPLDGDPVGRRRAVVDGARCSTTARGAGRS